MPRNVMRSLTTDRLVAALIAVTCLYLTVSTAQTGSGDGKAVRLAPTSPASVAQLPPSAKRFALIVGVDQYDDPQIVPLGGAGNDAKALSTTLVAKAGFPREQVFVLSTGSGERPTRGNILRRLANLRGVIPPDG